VIDSYRLYCIASSVANRAFPVVNPRTWNDLPDDVILPSRYPPSVSDIKRMFYYLIAPKTA